MGTYKLYVADPKRGQVGFLGTMRENGTPIAIAIRLKIANARISEAETLVVRDPGAGGAVEKLGKPDALFQEAVAPAERLPRDRMIAITNKYFDGIEQGNGEIVPFDSDCNRVQNGVQTTNNPELKLDQKATWNPLALGCREQLNTKIFNFIRKIYPRRFAVIDEERGVVFGFFMFHVPGTVKSAESPGHGTWQMPAAFCRRGQSMWRRCTRSRAEGSARLKRCR